MFWRYRSLEYSFGDQIKFLKKELLMFRSSRHIRLGIHLDGKAKQWEFFSISETLVAVTTLCIGKPLSSGNLLGHFHVSCVW